MNFVSGAQVFAEELTPSGAHFIQTSPTRPSIADQELLRLRQVVPDALRHYISDIKEEEADAINTLTNYLPKRRMSELRLQLKPKSQKIR